MAGRTRGGPGVRDFLEYYLLVLLAGKSLTRRQLADEIKDRSAENREFRATGVLRVRSSDMEATLRSLSERGWIGLKSGQGGWRITAAGRRARRGMEQEHSAGGDSKGRAARKLLSRIGKGARGSSVLDVGTGDGFLALKLARGGLRVLGIDSEAFDYSKDVIEAARRKGQRWARRVEFRRAEVTELRPCEGGFDFVVASQSVHCMRDPIGCLRGIYRVLKPGGWFLCLDFWVGKEGFLAHGFHCFLAISREEWESVLPMIGFDEVHTYKVKDHLVVESRKPAGRAR